MTMLLSMARTARSQGHGHHRAKPPHQTHLPTRMRSLPLREDGWVMNLPLLMILGLAFCLTEHNKCCASPCAIFISMLYAWNVF